MTNTIRTIARYLARFIVVWVVDAISLWATSLILPGVQFAQVEALPPWFLAASAALVLAIVNLLIRPAILLIARPLGWIVMFVIGFLVNAIVLWITAWLMPEGGFTVTFLGGIFGGIIFALFNTILTGILELDEDGSYFQNRIERLATQSPFKDASEPKAASELGRGLVMMEIDGLSFHHMQKAIADGKMPTIKRMIEEDGYVLSHVDCGIPSQTSACQAGIMFGDNDDIPAFRWYDKDQGKLYVSGSDAAAINARYARGNGLMRGGSSIDNMLNGDAEKSLLTLADLRTADQEQQKRRAEDIYLLMLNPNFLMRTIVLFLWGTVRELWEGWQQRRKDVQPRMNRLHHLYPFIRAATTVLVRDLAANLTILDIVRGAPSIYVTWPGYDEVAHHSGPWTSDAFGELGRYDRVIARIRRKIQTKAPRSYDLIILSDHGQSFGATFKQRYGMSLKEFIEQHLPAGTTVAQSLGGDTGAPSLGAVGAELGNVQQAQVGTGLGTAVARQGQKLLNKGVQEREAEMAAAAVPAQVTAYGSGNLAQVYFDLYPRRIKLSELDAAYPGMVESLVQHEGIGLVCGYADDGTPVAVGKRGTRNLHTGQVTGEDPLKPYAPAEGYGAASIEKRVWQVRRVMDFPHAGDLMVISTVYPDGTVAALEELIGSHGGMGGEQTDAFLFHPADLKVPDTRNSTDVFHILNGHRGAPAVKKAVEAAPAVADWAVATLRQGIGQVRTWLANAMRCAVLDRDAYERVVKDPYMTGPALLIALVMLALTAIVGAVDLPPSTGLLGGLAGFLLHILRWLLLVIVVFIAGYLLSKRGTFTRTFRAMGFAQFIYVILVLDIFRPLAPLVNVLAYVLSFFTMWMGAATAHEMRGWRSLLLPVIAFLVVVVGSALISILLASVGFTIDTLLRSLGLQP